MDLDAAKAPFFAVPARLSAMAVAGAFLFAGAATAAAREAAPVQLQGAEVRLMAGSISGATAQVGLEIRLAPHFKTYWRYPGDAGVPLEVSWKESHNIADVKIAWPAPRRFADGSGLTSIGYKGTVLFPLSVTLIDPKAPARLHLVADFAVCEALCLPAQAEFSLVLDGQDVGDADALIAAARAHLPQPAALGGTQPPAITAVRVLHDKGTAELEVEAQVSGAMADLFVEGPSPRWALPLPKKTALADGKARFTLPLEGAPSGATFEGTALTFTLVDPPKAIVVTHEVKAP